MRVKSIICSDKQEFTVARVTSLHKKEKERDQQKYLQTMQEEVPLINSASGVLCRSRSCTATTEASCECEMISLRMVHRVLW